MRNKKGVSAVIATVLIILITIAAVAILWRFVIPLIVNHPEQECFNANLDDGMKIGDSYTCKDTIAKTITVQISRGTQEYNLTDIQIVVKDDSGNSKSFLLLDSSTTTEPANIVVENLPYKNEEKVYTISYKSATTMSTPMSVTIAPVVENSKIVCDAKPAVQLKTC